MNFHSIKTTFTYGEKKCENKPDPSRQSAFPHHIARALWFVLYTYSTVYGHTYCTHRELAQRGLLPNLAGGKWPGRCDLYCDRRTVTPTVPLAGAAQHRASSTVILMYAMWESPGSLLSLVLLGRKWRVRGY